MYKCINVLRILRILFLLHSMTINEEWDGWLDGCLYIFQHSAEWRKFLANFVYCQIFFFSFSFPRRKKKRLFCMHCHRKTYLTLIHRSVIKSFQNNVEQKSTKTQKCCETLQHVKVLKRFGN